MCRKEKGTYFCLTNVGVKPNGLNPLTSANIWTKIGLPSFIYGCELWILNSTNLCEIERVQKYVAKSTQSLPIRTHDEIAWCLISWATMESIIDSRKLSYIGRIIRKSPGSVIKQVLMTRAYDFITANAERKIKTKVFIPDVFAICKKYEMFEYIDIYLKGGTFLEKRQWANIYKHNVKSAEKEVWRQNMQMKDDCPLASLSIIGPHPHLLFKIQYYYATQLHRIHKIVGNFLEYKQPCM